ncbi:MAG: methyltransferase domain-containing protein [Acidobacteria bacterium]|nr:methyltransferase domain-containing protein [Acidobacteriota bacterium]MCG3193681.1 putative trans-aconitate 2-methyltransferase [Thermoanaerobaculia bacterium]MCK6685631.1 methyltransferase domain-containing protein [Thermoanaerobaculia bacterium]
MNAKAEWDPAQYEKFLRERSLPFFDLLDLVRKDPEMRVVDLGSGTGELTSRLHETLAAKETTGIDSSESMLKKSAGFAREGLRFVPGDIKDWHPEGEYDLIFSNAALHFVPGHPDLFHLFVEHLSPRGQIAVHLPANQDYPTHRIAAELSREEPFASELGGYTIPDSRLLPEEYAVLFHRLGLPHQHVRLQVYGHRLASSEEVVEWVKGSFLNEHKARMKPETFEVFLAEYRLRLLAELPDDRPFFFTFKRLLLWASR